MSPYDKFELPLVHFCAAGHVGTAVIIAGTALDVPGATTFGVDSMALIAACLCLGVGAATTLRAIAPLRYARRPSAPQNILLAILSGAVVGSLIWQRQAIDGWWALGGVTAAAFLTTWLTRNRNAPVGVVFPLLIASIAHGLGVDLGHFLVGASLSLPIAFLRREQPVPDPQTTGMDTLQSSFTGVAAGYSLGTLLSLQTTLPADGTDATWTGLDFITAAILLVCLVVTMVKLRRDHLVNASLFAALAAFAALLFAAWTNPQDTPPLRLATTLLVAAPLALALAAIDRFVLSSSSRRDHSCFSTTLCLSAGVFVTGMSYMVQEVSVAEVLLTHAAIVPATLICIELARAAPHSSQRPLVQRTTLMISASAIACSAFYLLPSVSPAAPAAPAAPPDFEEQRKAVCYRLDQDLTRIAGHTRSLADHYATSKPTGAEMGGLAADGSFVVAYPTRREGEQTTNVIHWVRPDEDDLDLPRQDQPPSSDLGFFHTKDLSPMYDFIDRSSRLRSTWSQTLMGDQEWMRHVGWQYAISGDATALRIYPWVPSSIYPAQYTWEKYDFIKKAREMLARPPAQRAAWGEPLEDLFGLGVHMSCAVAVPSDSTNEPSAYICTDFLLQRAVADAFAATSLPPEASLRLETDTGVMIIHPPGPDADDRGWIPHHYPDSLLDDLFYISFHLGEPRS